MNLSSTLKSLLAALGMALVLSGCATGGNPKDPFEPFNRAMFNFNDKLDQAAVKPAATLYRDFLPSMVQTGIGNFFGNLGDVWTAVNNFLQGKGAEGLSDVMRVAINSTLGVGGLIDWGSEAGMVKHKEDFGQTLGVWGVKPGPYVVLPIYGSFTLRDTAAFPIDFYADPWVYVTPVYVRNIGTPLRLIDRRASVLGASDLIEDAALDKYTFVRDAYLQRREGQIGKEKPYTSYNDELDDADQVAADSKTAQGELLVPAPAKPQAERPASPPVAAATPAETDKTLAPALPPGNADSKKIETAGIEAGESAPSVGPVSSETGAK